MATIFTWEGNSENTSTTLKHFFLRTRWANFNQRGMTTNGEIGLSLIKFMKYGIIYMNSKRKVQTMYIYETFIVNNQFALNNRHMHMQLSDLAEKLTYLQTYQCNIFIPRTLDPKKLIYKEFP